MKYIIDIPKTVGMTEKVGSVHYTYFDGIQCKTIILKSDEIEELNSDYINEHFGELQDTAYEKGLEEGYKKCLSDNDFDQPCTSCDAYNRGFEDGKSIEEKGCEGCRYEYTKLGEYPCSECTHSYANKWTAKDNLDKLRGMIGEILKSGYKADNIAKVLEEMAK